MAKKQKLQVTTAAYSDIGIRRKANEDCYFLSPEADLMIVCDGMGGQVAGGFASKIAVETIKDVYYGIQKSQLQKILLDLELDLTDATARLVAAVRLANRRLNKIAAQFPKLRGMGTTVVALALDKTLATMVHVGDSRIFRISGKDVLQLTEDHSWLNELIEDDEINEEQIETFQEKNVITRALGTSSTVRLDVHCEKYRRNDVYVLSTDGMHNSVPAEDIFRIYRKQHYSVESFTKALIEKAKKRDGSDNITVSVAKMNKDCEETSYIGISTTIPEEDDRVTQKEDKLLQDYYGDPKSTLMKKADVDDMKQNRFLVPAMVILTGAICFLLGMILQNANSNPVNVPKRPITKYQTSINQRNYRTDSKPGDNQTAIVRSGIRKDAVLALIFFNSLEDYQNTSIEKRADILDKIQPYKNEGSMINSDFSLFLIDSENNVIRKTSGLKIPAPDTAAKEMAANKNRN